MWWRAYYLEVNRNIQCIWLIHSEANKLQAGTDSQARNLETLLRKRWEGKHPALLFPLQKIPLSDASDASTILREINAKMLNKWQTEEGFHLNYTGGTKAMATHVYRCLHELQECGQQQFSYLDANNFRLVLDNHGIERFNNGISKKTDDMRKMVCIEFEDLIALHGFKRRNKDRNIDFDTAQQTYNDFIDTAKIPTMKSKDGVNLEVYIHHKLNERLSGKIRNKKCIFHDWLIDKPNWKTKFQLDVIVINGYHLTGISCTCSSDKDLCKIKGFEIIQRTRQIGGDEARSILITRADHSTTDNLQDELTHETGSTKENILVLGVDDLRSEDIYLPKIEELVLD